MKRKRAKLPSLPRKRTRELFDRATRCRRVHRIETQPGRGRPPQVHLQKEKSQNRSRKFAEKLKMLAIEKRVVRSVCKPVYPETRRLFDGGTTLGLTRIAEEITKSITELEASKAAVEQAYAEQTIVVEKTWDQDKLSLVPGDLLLDGVCQKFGVRFRKEVDSSRAATLLNQSEVDDETRQILQEIGSPT